MARRTGLIHFNNSLTRLKEQLKALLTEEPFNSFFICTCFLQVLQFWHLLKFFGTTWVHWGKMKETLSFILKLCCCFFHHSEKINLLKAIDAANFEEVNKIKPYILQIKFQRNVGCNTYPQKLQIPLVSVFICLFLFSLLFFLLVVLSESFWLTIPLSHLYYFE